MFFVLRNGFEGINERRVQLALSKTVDGTLTECELMRLTGWRHKTVHAAVKHLRAEGVVTLEKGVVKLVSAKPENPKKQFDTAQTKTWG